MTSSKPLFGKKAAILVGNGFAEHDLTEAQRALIEAGASARIISPDSGLVNGWSGNVWGHHFAVDTGLGTALGADYDMLVIPGGQRSLDKLKLTAHTKRFISSFMLAEKPVAVFGEALHIIIFTDQIKGRTVTGPATMRDVVTQAGANWSEESVFLDKNLLTGSNDDANRANFVAAMIQLFTAHSSVRKAA